MNTYDPESHNILSGNNHTVDNNTTLRLTRCVTKNTKINDYESL